MKEYTKKQVTFDESRICFVVDEQDNIYAWAEPYLIDGEVKPSIGSPNREPIIIQKHEIPDGVDLGNCKYINGEVVYSPERAEERMLANLRSEREQEFAKYDKYQLPYVQATLTEEQIQEYDEWRRTWLDITETKVKPERPEWFDKI
jgi:hypothetical protein